MSENVSNLIIALVETIFITATVIGTFNKKNRYQKETH